MNLLSVSIYIRDSFRIFSFFCDLCIQIYINLIGNFFHTKGKKENCIKKYQFIEALFLIVS